MLDRAVPQGMIRIGIRWPRLRLGPLFIALGKSKLGPLMILLSPVIVVALVAVYVLMVLLAGLLWSGRRIARRSKKGPRAIHHGASG